MVKSTVIAALAALVSIVSALGGRFTNSFDNIRVGQLVTLTWELNDPSEELGRLTLMHETVPGAVAQYETICQWTDASGKSYGKGFGITTLDWVPNVAGPVFNMVFNDNDFASPIFEILAADGSHVTTVNVGDRFSNIMPQTATPIWYPNDPHSGAAAPTQAPSAAVSPPPALGGAKAVIAEGTSTTITATWAPAGIYTAPPPPSSAAPSTTSTSSSSSVYSASSSSTSVVPSSITTWATSTITFCSKCTAAALTSKAFSNATIPTNVPAVKNATTVVLPTQKPTQAVSNGAAGVGGSVAAIMGVVVGVVAWVAL